MAQQPINDAYILKSLYSALQILDILHDNEEMGVSEISKLMHQGKANTFRALYTLQAAGYVDKTKDSRYRLSLKFANYGSVVISRIDVLNVARPHLKALSEQFGQATHYAVLDDRGFITFLCRETPNPFFQSASHAGYQMEAYCSANGKMLLSLLDDSKILAIAQNYHYRKYTSTTITDTDSLLREITKIREQGYAEDLEESEIGLRCISVPLFSLGGKSVGSISLSGSANHIEKHKDQILGALLQTASTISAELGYK